MMFHENHAFRFFIFGVLSIISNNALACPPGYYPTGGDHVGWHGCAPMDGGISNEQENEEPTRATMSEEQWEERWGAIATANGAMGQAVSKRTKQEAEKEALADCKSRAGNQPCKLKLAYYNQCVALSWGSEGNVAARGPYIEEAEQSANQKCSESFSNCKIYYSACSLPVRIR